MIGPLPDPTFQGVGKAMIAGSAFTAAGAAVVGDDRALLGACLGAALFMAAWGLLFVGAPFSRTGTPSAGRIGSLFFLAVVGLGFQAISSPVLALGVAQVVFVILMLRAVRLPVTEPERRPDPDGDGPPGRDLVAVAARLLLFLSVVGAALVATESVLAQIAISALGLLLSMGIRVSPAGAGPRRSRS